MNPGTAGGRGASVQGIEGGGLVQYARRVFAGVRADALADGGKTVTFYPNGVENDANFPDPGDKPRTVPGNQYLAALLVTLGGFHFMRRDPGTRLWSHKNRSIGEVETSVARLCQGPKGRLALRSDPITEPIAVELLRNLYPGAVHEAFGGGYVFAGYIMVPMEGIRVAGATNIINAVPDK
jgi:hypothetical protein